jgi:CHASE3 domain sensor protein
MEQCMLKSKQKKFKGILFFMKVKKKNLFTISFMIFLFFVISIVSNYNSLENAKNAYVENNKTPNIEQNFLAINWAVACK